MKRAAFLAAHGAGLIPSHDYVLLDFCVAATYGELADRHHHGDTGKVNKDQTFSATYGYNAVDMIGFTAAVEQRLNVSLSAVGRGSVVLPTGPGQVAPPTMKVGAYVGRIYAQALAQNP